MDVSSHARNRDMSSPTATMLRNQGFSDAKTGKPPMSFNQNYMDGYDDGEVSRHTEEAT